MKRLSILLVIFLVFGMMFSNVYAEDKKEDNSKKSDTSTKIEVSFKVGNPMYSVNGKNIKGEASFVTAGKTFVPVKIITDAIGAELKFDSKTKTAVITYSGTEIKLTEKDKQATVNGKKSQIDIAPIIKNNSFMASISFLADFLGGDISNKDGKVIFTKEVANPNSIKDFSTLLKKTTKSMVGDSYYKWSINLPSDLKIQNRNFNGTKNTFIAQDKSYYLDLAIYDKYKDDTLDSITNDWLEILKKCTLIDYQRETKGGTEYSNFVYKDDYYTYIERCYVTDKKEIWVTISLDNELNTDNAYLEDKYQKLIDSFSLSFNKNNAEDISDVTSDGYRKYQDTRLKWSMKLHPDWEEEKDDNIKNRVSFDSEDSFFSVEIYSLAKGETLSTIATDVDKEYYNKYNSNKLKITGTEDSKIGKVDCKKINFTVQTYKTKFIGCDIYLIDKNYKYNLSYLVKEDVWNDINQRMVINGIVNSFRFTELDPLVIGKLMDADKLKITGKTRAITNDAYTMQVPIDWRDFKDNEKASSGYYMDNTSVYVTYNEANFSINDFIPYYDTQLAKEFRADFKQDGKTTLNQKGTTVYQYNFTLVKEDVEYTQIEYILQKGNKIYKIDFICESLYYGPDTINTFNKIWDSFELK